MKIEKVRYSGLFNLGNYQNESICFEAQVEEGEDPRVIVDELRELAREKATPNEDDLWQRIREMKGQVKELTKLCHDWEQRWKSIRQFLVTQGLNPDCPEMPSFFPSLPEPASEEVLKPVIELDDHPF